MGKVFSWSEAFNRHKRRGRDPSDAAYRADTAEQRWQRCPSTHCERSQECRSPSDCSGTGRSAKEKANGK